MSLLKILNYKCTILNGFQKALPLISSMKSKKCINFKEAFNQLNHFSSVSSASNKFLTLNNELLPPSFFPVLVPSCGMKVRGRLQLRCKDCYFERKDGIMYVNCSSYPRHKQRALGKREKYTWILTYCFQSKKRPY